MKSNTDTENHTERHSFLPNICLLAMDTITPTFVEGWPLVDCTLVVRCQDVLMLLACSNLDNSFWLGPFFLRMYCRRECPLPRWRPHGLDGFSSARTLTCFDSKFRWWCVLSFLDHLLLPLCPSPRSGLQLAELIVLVALLDVLQSTFLRAGIR